MVTMAAIGLRSAPLLVDRILFQLREEKNETGQLPRGDDVSHECTSSHDSQFSSVSSSLTARLQATSFSQSCRKRRELGPSPHHLTR